MKVDIKHKFTRAIIFSDERENNTTSLTLEKAISLKIDLSSADLSYANLRYADLRYANLSSANLRYADLRSAIGDMSIIFSMQLEKWSVAFTSEILAIGCQQHLIKEWREFSDDRINAMDSSALAWWKKWKDFIFTAIENSVNA